MESKITMEEINEVYKKCGLYNSQDSLAINSPAVRDFPLPNQLRGDVGTIVSRSKKDKKLRNDYWILENPLHSR